MGRSHGGGEESTGRGGVMGEGRNRGVGQNREGRKKGDGRGMKSGKRIINHYVVRQRYFPHINVGGDVNI